MKILALETGGIASTNAAVLVALELRGEEATVAAWNLVDEPRALGAKLMGFVDETLNEAGWKLDDLGGLVLGSGPGSWTSLRVGFATFKTLAQIAEIPLVAVPSFDALALAAARHWEEELAARRKRKKGAGALEGTKIMLAVAPCRPGELYGKLLAIGEGSVFPLQGERIAPAQELLDTAHVQALHDEIDGPLLVCGAAAIELTNLLLEREESHAFLPVEATEIAIEIALTGAAQIASGEVPELSEIEPLYLALSNAERVLAAKNGI